MLPSDLTLSALRFILSAKSRQSCKQDCEAVDFCNSLILIVLLRDEHLDRLHRSGYDADACGAGCAWDVT